MKNLILFLIPLFYLVSCKQDQSSLKETKSKVSRISVKENEFVLEDNKVIVFRGLNTSDPDKLATDGKWNKAYFEEIKRWNANVVRFPIHPPAVRDRGEEEYFKLLDQGIQWAEELDMYVILDWHSIGNLHEEKFFRDIYLTTKDETKDFWTKMAIRYGKSPTVAFYELFNEPTMYNGTLGEVSWEEWKMMNEELIDLIRKNGGEGIPLVAGFNWAYDLTPIANNPIDAKNIAYVSHPYPQKRPKPWEEKWTQDWGFAKEKYPIILTEIGYSLEDEPGAHIPVIDDGAYGPAITEYADERNISYVAWVFDPEWSPSLFTDWAYSPSTHGKFFKEKLNSYNY